ncbi:hypothetical protein ATY74_004717 [Vibrio parahaemolyticus]|nr:hypothetical protein [Vibrio parahaemolyticus]
MKKEEFDREHLMSVHHQPVVELANEARRKIAELIVNLDPESASLESTYENALKIIEDVQTSYKKLGKHTIEHESLFKALFGEKVGQFVIEQIKRISDEEWQGRKDALILIGDLYEKHRREQKNMKRREIHNRNTLFSTKHRLEARKLKIDEQAHSALLHWIEAVEKEDKERVFIASEALLPILSEMIYNEENFEVNRGAGEQKYSPQFEEKFVISKIFNVEYASEKFNCSPSAIKKARAEVRGKNSPEKIELLTLTVLMEILEKECAFGTLNLKSEEMVKLGNEMMKLHNNFIKSLD